MARIGSLHGMYVVLLAVFGALWLTACGETDQAADTLERYYYNHMTFDHTGQVYIYKAISDDGMPDEVWHYRFDPNFRGSYLHSAMYTPSGDLVQRIKERITVDGAYLLSLDLYYVDEEGNEEEIITRTTQERTFSFGKIDDKPKTRYVIDYIDNTADSVRVILTKERVVDGRTTYTYEGAEMPAVLVRTNEVLETETEGFTESEWKGTEIYVQDIGLVYYKKNITEQFVLEYELREIINYEEFRYRYGIEFESN